MLVSLTVFPGQEFDSPVCSIFTGVGLSGAIAVVLNFIDDVSLLAGFDSHTAFLTKSEFGSDANTYSNLFSAHGKLFMAWNFLNVIYHKQHICCDCKYLPFFAKIYSDDFLFYHRAFG